MKSLLIGILLLKSALLLGQQPQVWFVTGMSMNAYKGDLSSYEQFNSAFQLGVLLNRNDKLNGTFQLKIGSINGENKDFTTGSGLPSSPVANRFFKTTFVSANYNLRYYFVKKPSYMVFLSQGIGFMRFTPQDEFDKSLQDQPNTRLDGETYRNLSFMLPTKIGIQYILNNQFGIGFQGGLENTTSDYLDNISELGESGSDNVLSLELSVLVPLKH